MTTYPANFDDPRYLTELAFKNVIATLISAAFPTTQVYITGDTTPHTHPCVLVRARNEQEDIAPGTGIFKYRVECELQTKLDQQTAETAEQLCTEEPDGRTNGPGNGKTDTRADQRSGFATDEVRDAV